MAERGFDSPVAFKGFNVSDVDVAKTVVRLGIFDAEGDKTRIEMRGVCSDNTLTYTPTYTPTPTRPVVEPIITSL